MNTIDFDENRHFVAHVIEALNAHRFDDFESLLSEHHMSLSQFVTATIDALLPLPDLTSYYLAIQRFMNEGELK